jgi:hypothetical protein
MDPTDPGGRELLSDVDKKTSTYSARETTTQNEGGSKQGKKGREEGGKPKQPRKRAKAAK